MSVALNKTKRRIASIQSTKKITKAMELVATVKLRKFRRAMDSDALYCSAYEKLMGELFAHDSETKTHYALVNEEVAQSLFIVITSTLGLCAGYNNDLYRFLETVAKPGDAIAPIGNKGLIHYFRSERAGNVNDEMAFLNLSLDPKLIHDACDKIKNDFNEKKYRRICLVYTNYVNSVTFRPTCFQLLPVSIPFAPDEDEESCPPDFDPSARELIHKIMPDYLAGVFYERLVESQLSEQASRRTAMESANRNADDLLSRLTIEYNKARQAAITSEIAEVYSASQGT